MNVLFLPGYPDKEFYTIVALFMRLGWFATQEPEAEFDFAMSWQDSTWVDECEVLSRVAMSKPVLNLHCRDISKRRVEQEFYRRFRRMTFVDPHTFSGRAVRKFDENARGGSIVTLPVSALDERYVFQRLIDSTDGEFMVEYRVPIVLDTIPLVYRERKAVPVDRIKTAKHSVEITSADEVFSEAETAGILAFCAGMGLDFGELDVLRDHEDGEIYILDANKTPGGFGMFNKVNWRHEQRQQAIEILAEALHRGMQLRLQ